MDPSEFDATGNWIGTCEKCGTNHDGEPPNTIRGGLACLQVRAELIGDPHLIDSVHITRDWFTLVTANALDDLMADSREGGDR